MTSNFWVNSSKLMRDLFSSLFLLEKWKSGHQIQNADVNTNVSDRWEARRRENFVFSIQFCFDVKLFILTCWLCSLTRVRKCIWAKSIFSWNKLSLTSIWFQTQIEKIQELVYRRFWWKVSFLLKKKL
jgi:hypothetical protein